MEETKLTTPTLDMKDRIKQLMDEVKLNQRDFASAIGISASTLSSIFNGRTSATLNHARALHSSFPEIRMEWLLFGEGQMYKSDEKNAQPSGIDSRNNESTDASHAAIAVQGELPLAPAVGGGSSDNTLSTEMGNAILTQLNTLSMEIEIVKNNDKPARQISEVRIFFDDGTFQVFAPKG